MRRFSNTYRGGDEIVFHGDLDESELAGDFSGLSFDGRSLRGARLTGTFDRVTFIGANLEGAELSGSFTSCNFNDAILRHSFTRGEIAGRVKNGRFSNTPFVHADLSQADLRGGSFRGSNFTGAGFGSAILGKEEGVDLRSAILRDAALTDEQLRTARRLRCSTLPGGARYMGQFDLPGDREDADKEGFDPNDQTALTVFYTKCAD